MKNQNLFLIVFLCLLVSSCGKEEADQEPPPVSIVTIVEGRVINHITQQPIKGETLELVEFIEPQNSDDWFDIKRSDETTDENGEFKFNYTSYDHHFDNVWFKPKTECVLWKYECNPIINEVIDEAGKFSYGGFSLYEGDMYFFDIELTLK